MKKTLITALLLLTGLMGSFAQDVKSMKWADVCNGKMGDAWYASNEAKDIANIVVAVQKTNGGWMKNDELHKLTSSQLETLKNNRDSRSCLDNTATTQEMRFLARVYQGTKVEQYRTAFGRALNMIFEAEKSGGGWSQYWPLSNDNGYQDYITFNDDLMTNVMKLLRDIHANKGIFKDMVDEAQRARCQSSFDKALDVILKCQIDDNGVKAAWCAQHDPVDFLPTEGRPHELPSVSGYESASLLSFLMTIEKPSAELQSAITAAVEWLDSHKIEGKAIEDFTNANGEKDRRIIDKSGSCIWGRFIQLGGTSAQKVYGKLFDKLKTRGKHREYNGKRYTEEEIARFSYDGTKAYQPIFAIYKDEYPHLYYRFLYHYADAAPALDSQGQLAATSLMATNRASYQYLGSWCQEVINVEYPAWKRRIEAQQSAGNGEMVELSASTYEESDTRDGEIFYLFDHGYSVSNKKDKGYANGTGNFIKYSANDYFIHVPAGKQVTKVTFEGYDNYDVDAYIKHFAGTNYAATDYVFPAKKGDKDFVVVAHTFDLQSNPATGDIRFTIDSKQCCLTITLTVLDTSSGITSTTVVKSAKPVKRVEGHRIVIQRGSESYDTLGRRI